MKKKLFLVSALSLSLALAACNGDDKENGGSAATEGLETNIVTIATGGASGPYNIIGTTLADQYVKEFDVNSRTQTTGASVENINLLEQGKAEMAFVMSDALSQAVNGEVSFKEPIKNVSQIATLYPNVVQIITKEGSGIKTIEDLKGKRIAVGDQNSGVEINARVLLNGHGITYEDVKVDYLGYAEAADGLKAGTIDAAFLTSGLPNASVMELAETTGIQLVSVNAEKVAEIAKEHPYFISYDIAVDTYKNEEAITTAAVPNALVVRTDMSEDDVYDLTKKFFESIPTLQNSHQAANDITLDAAQESVVAPIHPGAQRYYDEQKK